MIFNQSPRNRILRQKISTFAFKTFKIVSSHLTFLLSIMLVLRFEKFRLHLQVVIFLCVKFDSVIKKELFPPSLLWAALITIDLYIDRCLWIASLSRRKWGSAVWTTPTYFDFLLWILFLLLFQHEYGILKIKIHKYFRSLANVRLKFLQSLK